MADRGDCCAHGSERRSVACIAAYDGNLRENRTDATVAAIARRVGRSEGRQERRETKTVCGTAVAFCFVVAAQFAAAQNLMGKWTGSTAINGQRYAFTMTVTAGNHYMETVQSGTLMTAQSGTYVLTNGLLVRNVIDWNPKQQLVVDARGSHYEPMAKPPGGTFRVTFTNANTMVLEDVNLKGTLTYQRVQ